MEDGWYYKWFTDQKDPNGYKPIKMEWPKSFLESIDNEDLIYKEMKEGTKTNWIKICLGIVMITLIMWFAWYMGDFSFYQWILDDK